MANKLADRSLLQIIMETSLFVILAVTALVGNSCALWVFYKRKDLRKKLCNFYLITLAITDVFASSVCMPFIIGCAATGRDVIGFTPGQVLGVFSVTLSYVSVLTTIMIAVNRFFCVTRQRIYRKWFKPKNTLVMIMMIWIASPIIPVAAFASGAVVYRFNSGRVFYFAASGYYSSVVGNNIAGAVASVCVGLFSLVAIMYCYYKVRKTVQGHSNSLQNSSANDNTIRLSAEEIHVTKSLVALVMGFSVCWFMSYILDTISLFIALPRGLEILLTYLVCTSSAINPILYNAFNRRFRIEFFKIFNGVATNRVEA